MEIYAYLADWKRLSEEWTQNASLADSDALFRIVEESDSDWIAREPSLESNTSFLYNSAIGSIFVELVDDELVSTSVARMLGTFLVSFCPQVTELEDYSPPQDMLLPDVFYAVISPHSLRDLLHAYDKIQRNQLRKAVTSYRDEQPNEEISSADAFMNYLQRWRDAMHSAMERACGLLVFCA